MKYYLCVILLVYSGSIFGQVEEDIQLSFVPMFQKEVIKINHFYTITDKDSLQVETLKFYISNIELYKNDSLVFKEKNSFHLIDIEDKSSLNVLLKSCDSVEYTHIQFNVGIDSITNVSGAFGGDLDPTNGMYWTWQSGYINFKLEGVASHCPARKNRFIYHIGGYQKPFYPLKNIRLQTLKQNNILVEIDIHKIFANVDPVVNYNIMRPTQKAMDFADLFPSLFSILK